MKNKKTTTKRTIALLCLCFFVTFIYSQKNITGDWEGKINAGSTTLSVVFHFEKQNDSLYSGSMDSPDQGVKGIHCNNVLLKGDSVIIQVKMINGGYNGLLVNDSSMNGNWTQGLKIPLMLKRGNVIDEKVTEQNNDNNCKETDIVLNTKTGKIFGTLCEPIGFAKGPVALIIAGSGPTDRDCNSSLGLKTDAYKILAHKLASQNIATVRYDKRGLGESQAAMKSESDLRFEDYVNDASDWVKLLKSDKGFTKVIIIGHSEGSLVGMIAAKTGYADKYISIAGAGESIDKILKRQLSVQPKSFQDSAFPIIDSLKAGKTVSHVDPMLNSLFRLSIQPFLIDWMKYNPAEEIGKLNLSVLILQGTNDIQVQVEDAKELSAGDKNARLILLENMNHIFRIVESTGKQANVATYNNPALPIDPELVSAICDFINKK
jgi:pimeloyl-ACP methyl ester carboxylesterase